MRPVISTVGIQLYGISKWVNFHLKYLLPAVDSYIKDSDDLIKQMLNVGDIDRDYFLVTADAVAMYPNKDTVEGIAALQTALDTNLFRQPFIDSYKEL